MIRIGDKQFEYAYYPFFRIKKSDYFSVFGMKLPSGNIEEIIVFEVESANQIKELHEYAKYLIREYILEDDIMLTPRALILKKDLMELFYEA